MRINDGLRMKELSMTPTRSPKRIIVINSNPWTRMRVKLRRQFRPEFREWLTLPGLKGYIPIHIDSGYCIDRPDHDAQPMHYLIAEIEPI